LVKSCQKVGKKFVKICPELVALAENSETVRRRGRGRRGRRFVVPRPGATLSHLVKTKKMDIKGETEAF
jgi:hypothetical protein